MFISYHLSMGIFYFIKREQKLSLYSEKITLAMNSIQNEAFDEALLLLREAKALQPIVEEYAFDAQIRTILSR